MMEKISNWKGYENPLDDIDPNRVCSCLTTHCGKDSNGMQLVESLPIKNATKKGYLEAEEGDGVDISGSMEYHRGNVQKGTSQTLLTSGDNVGVVVKEKRGNVFHLHKDTKHLKETIEKNEFEKGEPLNLDLYNRATYKESQTLCDPRHNSQRLFDGLRIRKLTPKECMRLMGFEDEDTNNMVKAGLTDSAIYHCAGDSIVSTVLVAIFSQLFDNKNKHITVVKEYLNHRFNK